MRYRSALSPLALSIIAALASNPTVAAEPEQATNKAAEVKDKDSSGSEDTKLEKMTVTGKSVSYANNVTTEEMTKQQTPLTSVLSIVDNLPGVLVNEGDTFGADDWSTTLSIRGFQLNLDEQQIGITIDGIPNGNSNYGGGAKANRYIDTENLKTVEVSQGTADIASRSNEALGGTLNFTTIDPTPEESLTVSFTTGDFGSQKYFTRYNTGEFAKDTSAWISLSSAHSSDWMEGSAQNTRDHIATKGISSLNGVKLTGYLSYDDIQEDNYQRVSLDEFNQNPDWDRLISNWTGIPYIDQLYRRGWSTLRENTLGYLTAEFSPKSYLDISANAYFHRNKGRGDWVPPYIVDVNFDGAGAPQSELVPGNTYLGGTPIGRIQFVDAAGNTLTPIAGCESSLTFPYGGAGPEYDPACYAAGALPVGSYRTTNYAKERNGINLDFSWDNAIAGLDNTLRGGIWYEDYLRKENRSWQKVIDSRTGFEHNHIPYWVQYKREFPVTTLMAYLEDAIKIGAVEARLGVKTFNVDLERKDLFTGESISVSSDSDALPSAGLIYRTPVKGLSAFVGYAENFAAIKDTVLEREASSLENIKPETAKNTDLGLRYASAKFEGSVTYYNIKFDNRLVFIAPDSPDGINYLIGTNGSYVNVGGIESKGIEAAVSYYPGNNWTIYGSYTNNDSTYVQGTEDYPSGNTVFGSVEDMAVLSFDWNNDKYFAGLSNKYVGERWLDPDNTLRLDAYTVSDLYIGVNLSTLFPKLQQAEARMTVNNLTNERYIGGVAGGSGGWLGAPRTAAFNIRATF